LKRISKEHLVRYFDAFSRSDFATMESYYHDDIVLTFPGTAMGGKVRGKQAVCALFRAAQEGFAGTLRFHCTWAGVVGDRGIVQWFTTGKPRMGGDYINRGCVVWRFAGGKIIDFQDYIDTEIVSAFFPGGVPSAPPPDVKRFTDKAFFPE
jgi:ketosteroid isomerase-like protein